MFSKLIFNSPWYYGIICFACGAAFAAFLYYRNKKNSDIHKRALYLMTALRFISTSLIVFLLLNIFLKQLKNETQQPLVLLAIDNSRSIVSTHDSSFIKNQFLKELFSVREELGKDFSVKTLFFGSKTTSGENEPDFSEKETDIDNVISDIENNYSNQNIGALILVSDGIYNKGANPVYSVEKLKFPVYTVALGDTTELKDISVKKINHNQFAYSGNIFPVEVLVNCKKFAGKEVTVSLADSKGKKISQQLKINSDNVLSTLTFTLNAEAPGVQHYHVSVTALEGETNVSNNNQSFVIEVIDNRSKILLLANAPHPDVSAIKDALLNNGNYEVEYGLSGEFNKPVKPYSLVIIHGFSNANTQLVNDCRNNNIPYWIVNPTTSENLPGLKISSSFNKQNDAEPVLNNSFGLFSISDELKKFIGEFPAIKTFFGNYSVNNGANILIQQKIGVVETESPVLLFYETNGLKTGLFIGDGLWRWKLRDYSEHKNPNLFNELISKTIQYLTVKSDKSFFRLSAPKIVNENEIVELGAEVYNKTYELITEPDVTLTLTNDRDKQFNYTFSKTSNAYKLNLGFLAPGEYRYEAKVKVNGEVLVRKGSIVVREIIVEKLNTVADHKLLYQISSRTGGKLFYKNELIKLQDDISKNQLIKPVTYSTHLTTSIIDLKWIFFIILFVLSLEWFLRKRFTVI